ncbi:MAG: hypothetical protein QM402_07565 [Synergistota bacterium]|nr:hypothetical protein [Synergistota bacterium]
MSSTFKDCFNSFPWGKAVAVTGALGAGKTEWALNLSMTFLALGESVTLADVDILNPYFTVRSLSNLPLSERFSVVCTAGEARWSDLPIVPPAVGRALLKEGERVCIDVGGGERGATALAQIAPLMDQVGYTLLYVVNPYQPSTASPDGVQRLLQGLERASKTKVTALVANPHLMEDTTPDVVVAGYEKVNAFSRALGIPILFVGVSSALYDEVAAVFDDTEAMLWPIERRVLMPWEKR